MELDDWLASMPAPHVVTKRECYNPIIVGPLENLRCIGYRLKPELLAAYFEAGYSASQLEANGLPPECREIPA